MAEGGSLQLQSSLKHLYSSDVILATRAWNLRGSVKILKQAARSCFCIFIYKENASFLL
jgi:hypothetical protein